MRASFLTISICCIVILLIGCSKVNYTPPPAAGNTISLAGNWQWNRSTSGWGLVVVPGPDTIIMLSFFKDSTYAIQLNQQLQYAGRFSTIIKPSDIMTTISFATDMDVANLNFLKMENITRIKNDTIMLSGFGIADGPIHVFTLIK